ncbi:hypothetical protein C2S53_020843 [Perilla frutescens var. hirtella]|uniref:DUF7870 domain-containing protein n=1 Tax=Perilla frutescens var. hirtella TaxID=608512 RepID=A0AAD4IR92_PERFH|nr:hypothetical protein C2S53_020843 [Perilla frutescens var. hirtella]
MDESGRGRRPKSRGNNVDELSEFEIGLNSDAIFVIKLPDSRSLRVVSRSLFLAVILLALPSIGSIIGAASNAPPLYDPDTSNSVENLPLLLRDLMEDGLITKGHKGFVLIGSGFQGIEDEFGFLRDAGVDFIAGAGNMADAHQVFDYMCAPSFSGIELMGGVIKDGGLAIAPLGADLSAELRLLRSFKIVYLRRLNDNTVVAMRKSTTENSAAVKQVVCGIATEKKEAALRGLEDVYLEPPRQKSGFMSRKIKFLPDLMRDALDEYPRRVLVADDSNALDWFYKNYPMRGQEFEVYEMEGDWIGKTGVRGEDYVVVKAEAGVVEEMLRDKTLCVVDELFLECEKGRKKGYWECVALYGKVRDEGIAVHQWW